MWKFNPFFFAHADSSPFCSVEDETGGGGGGGGGAPSDEPIYSKSHVEKVISERLAKQARSYEAKIAEISEQLKSYEAIKAEYEKFREEKELEGKSAQERLEHKYAKEIELREKKIKELESIAAEREKLAQQASEQLKSERIQTRLASELAKAKVIPQFADKAVRLAMLDLQDVQIDEHGTITATYGDFVDKPLAQVVEAWVKDNPNFLPAPSGGAGTRAPNGHGASRSYAEMSDDDLIREANRLRGR